MATHHPIRKTVAAAPPVIPDKLYFRIGDVARILEVPAYVLRFWETEFPQLKPNKGGTGQRLYRKRDVEMALRIKTLLYDQGYTIPGARQVFKAEAARSAAPLPEAMAVAAEPESLTIPESAVAARMAAPAAVQNSVDAVRREALEGLRADVRELLAMLSAPVSGAHPPVERAADPKLATMRPRLVLEPRAGRAEKTDARPRLQLHQPGLFGLDDSGPQAS